MNFTSLFRTVPALVLAAVLPQLARAQSSDEGLSALFQRYLDAKFQLQPVTATALGDHRFDRELDDLSPAARAQWLALDRRTLASLQSLAMEQLSAPAQIDYKILKTELERSIWLTENLRPFEQDPRSYTSYIGDSVYLLLEQSTLPKETNLSNAIVRMRQIPKVIAAAQANLRNPPRQLLDTAIRQNRGSISFYESDLFEFAGTTPQLDALKQAAAEVRSQLEAYQKWLEQELLPRANGEWRIGREKFSRKLELESDAGLSADQVLAEAQAEFARVQRDLYVIARQLWSRYFAAQPLPPDDESGRRSTIRLVLEEIGKDHCEPKELVGEVTLAVSRIKEFIAQADILRLPEPDTCRIVEMPEFQRGNSTAYMNPPPPLDPRAKGFYAVSPPPKDWEAPKIASYLSEYNRKMLQVLTIHEAYPGHYIQFEYANRNPSKIRRVLQSGVYVEGWAVYTEQMMLDQGYGNGDLALRMNQLKFYLRAVANTILDHQMHCTAMSDDEAFKFLTEGAYQSEGEARLKIVRAKQSSVQLSTYFVGRLAHYRLRQAIAREQGANFNLGRYHEAVLSLGAVPVKYLPELVRARLAQPR